VPNSLNITGLMNGKQQVPQLSKTYDTIMKGQLEEQKAWDEVVNISRMVSERWNKK